MYAIGMGEHNVHNTTLWSKYSLPLTAAYGHACRGSEHCTPDCSFKKRAWLSAKNKYHYRRTGGLIYRHSYITGSAIHIAPGS